MKYIIDTHNGKKREWKSAAVLYYTDRHTAKFIESIIREKAQADTRLEELTDDENSICVETTRFSK